MPPKRRPAAPAPSDVAGIKPLIKPLLEPFVESVVDRLDRTEKLLQELKTALDVQFKRTAQIQAQLDIVAARLAKRDS